MKGTASLPVRLVGSALVAAGSLLVALMAGGCSSSEDFVPIGSTSPMWSGAAIGTYVCEDSPTAIQIRIEDGVVTLTDGGGRFPDGTTGTVTQQAPGSYRVVVDDGGSVEGRLYVDPTAHFALLVMYYGAGSTSGVFAVLQNGDAELAAFSLLDPVGGWSGTSVRVDNSFNVTATSSIAATFADSAGELALSGSDGDGAFSAGAPAASLMTATLGVWDGNTVDWPGDSYEAIYALSYSKSAMAAAFLLYDAPAYWGTCDSSIFDDLSLHKFALLRRP